MQTIGILGGLGPEATVDYYREIIDGFNKLNGNGSLYYPEIIIYSVNMSKFIGMLEAKKYSDASAYLTFCINNLDKAGADFAVMSANTPHLLFDEIISNVNLPLISIVEACAQAAKERGFKRCGLLGTKFTMQNDFYRKVFGRFNIEIFVPDSIQIEIINKRLFTELELGVFKEETKNELLNMVLELKRNKSIDAVILGCTEFPLMFTEQEYLGMPFLNTTRIHVESIIKECLNGNS